MAAAAPVDCPCGGGRFADCCAPFLDGRSPAPDAARLMRSRYSAYVLGNEAYLRATWDERTCPAGPLFEPPLPKWLGLKLVQHQEAGATATVEFVARYKVGGRAHRLHEVSRFERQTDADGRAVWRYLDGTFPEAST